MLEYEDAALCNVPADPDGRRQDSFQISSQDEVCGRTVEFTYVNGDDIADLKIA
jgi:hypothetical protein